MESFDRKKGFLSKEFLLSNAVYFVVIAFIITMSIVSDRFLTGKNIINLLTQSTVLMALSIGMALTMLTQGIDMSMGSLLFLFPKAWMPSSAFPTMRKPSFPPSTIAWRPAFPTSQWDACPLI